MPGTHTLTSNATRITRRGHRAIARIAAASVAAFVFFIMAASTVDAQTSPQQKSAWEFLVSSGRFVPTGAHRHAVGSGNLTALQVSRVIRPALAITGSLGWARSRDIASSGDPRLDVFTYDLGAEARANPLRLSGAMTFRPFAGVGAGGRSYNYRHREADATHNVAAYGSAGGELGIGRVRLRLEARDYVTGFEPLSGEGAADVRNDVVVMAGLRFVAR